ncbi:hypothetical protein NDU88_009245, partial [Pleurodeles waltl]
MGERVLALEDRDAGHSEEIECLQQEILRLQEQQIDLQLNAEDLENRSRQNNIRIQDVPTTAEGSNLG